jgi:hypothetical protein
MHSTKKTVEGGVLGVRDRVERIEGPRVGVVVTARAGAVTIDYEGNPRGPLAARVSAAIDDAALEVAARERQDALIFFDGGDPGKPVLTALLRSATPHIDAVLAGPLPAAEKVAKVDGKRVLIEGREEVVLKCGKATLTLRRDGKVVLRGVNVTTQADGVHKVRGGKVEIN